MPTDNLSVFIPKTPVVVSIKSKTLESISEITKSEKNLIKTFLKNKNKTIIHTNIVLTNKIKIINGIKYVRIKKNENIFVENIPKNKIKNIYIPVNIFVTLPDYNNSPYRGQIIQINNLFI
jgi:hypothetical protein